MSITSISQGSTKHHLTLKQPFIPYSLQLSAVSACISSMGTLFSSKALGYTFRRLSNQKGFTLTVLLTLGLCIGANIAIFSIVDAILLKPLPLIKSEGLITAYNSYPGAGVERSAASLPNYYERKDGIDAFTSVSIIQYGSAVVGDEGTPVRIKRDRVSPEFFETLGIPLLMGRTFTDDEMLYENSGKSIVTHAFWQSYFDGAQDVLGSTFVVDGYTIEVIGVLPKGFQFLSSKAQFYVPAASNLKGVGYKTYVKDLRDDHVSSIKPTLLLLQTGVLCLLLIGGVNIVNLFLIRASALSKEMAVRQALGAGRRDILQSTLYETLNEYVMRSSSRK